LIVIINACKYNQSLGFQSMLLTDFTFVFRVTIYDFFLAVFWFPASARFLFRQKLPSRLLPSILPASKRLNLLNKNSPFKTVSGNIFSVYFPMNSLK